MSAVDEALTTAVETLAEIAKNAIRVEDRTRAAEVLLKWQASGAHTWVWIEKEKPSDRNNVNAD